MLEGVVTVKELLMNDYEVKIEDIITADITIHNDEHFVILRRSLKQNAGDFPR